jgi:alpha-tubulin suppressor-like RCC1 family protein
MQSWVKYRRLTGWPVGGAGGLLVLALALSTLDCTTARRLDISDGGVDHPDDTSSADRGGGDAGGGRDGGPGMDGGNPETGVTAGCDAGTHNCSGLGCVANNSIDHCGGQCTACAAPAGGTAICGDAGACDFDCGALKKCNGKCGPECCADEDCPVTNGKNGQCDTSTNTCSYLSCAAGFKACGGSCIAASACCVASDCTGVCTTCSGGSCVPVTGQDDPIPSRCAGTCDATGVCKSKRGQTCNTVGAGCVGGTTCAPDGYCCDTACTGACVACDITGYQGTCTNVALGGGPHSNHPTCVGAGTTCAGTCGGAGTCSYPSVACGAAPTCSGTDQVIPQQMCNAGACQTPAAQTCVAGFACAANACKTTCQTSSDCQAGYFCYNQQCHSDVVSVALGLNHTCAALKDGRVRCWGGTSWGDNVNHSAPISSSVQVTGISNATMVRATSFTTCALSTAGTVSCWGDGSLGTLGSGVVPPIAGYNAAAPVPVVISTGAALTGMTTLVGGAHAFCAYSSAATYCWGDNASSKLGFATPTYPDMLLSATLLQGATNPSSLGMGNDFQVVVFGSTTVNPWGYNYQGSVKADPTNTIAYFSNFAGQPFYTNNNVIDVAVGIRSSCLLFAAGTVQCWGGNVFGQIGNGTTDPVNPPGTMLPGLTATRIVAGQEFVCAKTADTRNLVCWGLNADGVINSTVDSTTHFEYPLPTTVSLGLPTGLQVADIASSASANHICAILSDGSPWCWGYNSSLQTGTGVTSFDSTVPMPVQANW